MDSEFWRKRGVVGTPPERRSIFLKRIQEWCAEAKRDVPQPFLDVVDRCAVLYTDCLALCLELLMLSKLTQANPFI